jgi:hypothetical protein
VDVGLCELLGEVGDVETGGGAALDPLVLVPPGESDTEFDAVRAHLTPFGNQ